MERFLRSDWHVAVWLWWMAVLPESNAHPREVLIYTNILCQGFYVFSTPF